MCSPEAQGLYRRRRHGCTVRDPSAEPSSDLVNRNFTVDGPNRLWVTDITEHPTGEGKLYCAAVMDAYSRRIIGWSIAEHMRTELMIDALGMATLRRRPEDDRTILHSDHGSQYTSWAFGQRLRAAGLLHIARIGKNLNMVIHLPARPRRISTYQRANRNRHDRSAERLLKHLNRRPRHPLQHQQNLFHSNYSSPSYPPL